MMWGALLVVGCAGLPPASTSAPQLKAAPPKPPPDPFAQAARGALAKRRARRDAKRVWPPRVSPLVRQFTGGVPGASYALQSVTTLCEALPNHGLAPSALGCPDYFAALAQPPTLARDAQVEVLAREVVLRFAWQCRGQGAGPLWAEDHAWRQWMRRRRRLNAPPPVAGSAVEAGEYVLQTVAEHLNAGRIRLAIEWPQPQGGQYAALVAQLRRYRTIGDTFLTLPKGVGRLRQRARSPKVAVLRARLAQEGYLSQPKRLDVFDHTLAIALADYQRAHGIKPAAWVTQATLKTLRISPEIKRRRIISALDAWRRAAPRSGTFVQVNIPAFEGELRSAQSTQLRFPVIVGQARLKRIDGALERPNATPVLRSHIESISFNPHWNIPSRILEEDILPKNVEFYAQFGREAWLEENGYEIVAAGTRSQRVRQPAGPRNPLGQVKFNMPNAQAIYLHDTPRKRLFSRQRRDFSHGCIRVKRPLVLAKALIDLVDRPSSWRRAQRWLSSGESASLVLSEPVPVFLDYVLVWIDAQGRPRFLGDIYGKTK